MQRSTRLQGKIVNNRERIRSQLKVNLFNLDRMKQNIENNNNVSLEVQTPLKKIDMRVSNKKFNQQYELSKIIGEGAHGIVKLGFKKTEKQKSEFNKNHIQCYAIKIFRTNDPEIIATIRKTYQLAKILSHPNIIQLYELYIDETKGYSHLVMEYSPLNSLESQLHYFIHNEQLTSIFIFNLLKTLEYMHSRGVAHRDLKPENILINPNQPKSFKIIDLGVSKKFYQRKSSKQIEMWTSTGTIFYSAPEIFCGYGYTFKIDIWAIGIIMFQCLTNQLPFQEDTISDTIESIIKGQIDWDQFNFSKQCKDLLSRLLQNNPRKRLSAKYALQHPFLTQYQYINKKISACHDDLFVNDGYTNNSQLLLTNLGNSQQAEHNSNKNRKLSNSFKLNQDPFEDIHLTVEEEYQMNEKVYLKYFTQNRKQSIQNMSNE